jgi:hypothetical protein
LHFGHKCQDKDQHIFDYYKLDYENILSWQHIQVCSQEDFLGIQRDKNTLLGYLFHGTDCLDHRETAGKDWIALQQLYKKNEKLLLKNSTSY